MSDPSKSLLDGLEKRIGETARSRFIAAKRLEKRDQRISWIVAMASAYVIILTVLPYLIKLPVDTSDLLNLVTVGLAIVILVSSLVIGSRRDAVNAEQHHRSALELNELKNEIIVLKCYENAAHGIDKGAADTLFNKYSNILQKYSVNHDPIDYDAVKLDRPQDYTWLTWRGRFLIWLKMLLINNLSIFVMFALTILVLVLVFGYALPSRLPRG